MNREKKIHIISKTYTKYFYIAPVLILIVAVFIYPLFQVMYSSFFNIRTGAGGGTFIGFENYKAIFQDITFWRSLGSTLIWTLGNSIVQLSFPLLVAILLNKKLKGMNFFRVAVLLPWIVPMVGLAVAMRWMLLPNIGIVNGILRSVFDFQINFLGSKVAAFITLIIFNSWKLFPFGTLLILSALQTIPDQVYEAAHVDGASPWQQFIYITFPLLGRVIWFMGFLVFVWNFNTFDTIWLTTEGGPGNILKTVPILIYRTAFRVFRLGEGATIATIGAVFLIIIGILYFKFLTPKREN